MNRPSILLIMTDEERYPPPYESEAVRLFRTSQLTARESIRSRGVEFHRHYAGSTACTPSRATLFTGQYPSLHGVTSTAGIAKQANDSAMGWLDPNSVPTPGDSFRAGGYRTHFDAVAPPTSIESVITTLPTGESNDREMWKLNHYYGRLDERYAAQGVPLNPSQGPAAEPFYELHNLTADPEERRNRTTDQPNVRSQMRLVLDSERNAKRLIPALRNEPT